MRSTKKWLSLGFATAAVLSLGVLAAASPAQVKADQPTTHLFTTTTLPDPSESLAFDPATKNVFAMTEAETGDEGGVDTDAVTAAADVGCGEDEHNIAVINGTTGAIDRYITISGEAEYMAVDSHLEKLYVPQYNDEGLTAPQCLAVVDVNPLSPTAWTVKYYSIPFTFVDPRTGIDTGFQYDPTGVAVDEQTGIVYIGGKMPEVEDLDEGGEAGEGGTGGESGEDVEWGIGAIMAFDGTTDQFVPTFVPAGDDPESVVYNAKEHRVYAANEDEGTLTITSAITHGGQAGQWNTDAFRGKTFTLGPIFDANECLSVNPNTYQPAEADKLAVDERSDTVYLTDDRYRVAAIPGGAMDVSGVKILHLPTPETPDGSCPTSDNPEVYNYANNLVLSTKGGRDGLLYVTSENHMISIVDLSTFTKVGEVSIGDSQGLAGHIDWPVIDQAANRLYITDELRPAVYIYDLRDFLTLKG